MKTEQTDEKPQGNGKKHTHDKPIEVELLEVSEKVAKLWKKKGIANVCCKIFADVAARVRYEPEGPWWLTPLAGFMAARDMKLKSLDRFLDRFRRDVDQIVEKGKQIIEEIEKEEESNEPPEDDDD